jgi:hypothetical protein
MVNNKSMSLVLLLATIFLLGAQGRVAVPEFPTGWSALLPPERDGKAEYSIFVDRKMKHDGKVSCCIRSELVECESAILMQTFRADNYRGKRLRMTAFVRTEGVKSKQIDGGGAGLMLSAHGEKKGNLTADHMLTRRIMGTTNWSSCAIVLDIPEDAAMIAFGASLPGTGKVWVSDFRFEVVGKDVNTTGDNIPQFDITRGELKDLPKKPINLDFER